MYNRSASPLHAKIQLFQGSFLPLTSTHFLTIMSISTKAPHQLPYRDPLFLSNLDEFNITSERLHLRLIQESDAEDIFPEFTPELARYMTPKPADDISQTLDFIRSARRKAFEGKDAQLCIYQKETSEFLGCLGLHGAEDPSTPEIGLWIKKSAHGHAYGREAAHALTEWAKENLSELQYFLYPVGKENIPSRKIAEALGGEIHKAYMSTRGWAPEFEMLLYRIPVA